VPFEAGDHRGFFNAHEDADGNPLDFDGRIDVGDGSSLDLVAIEHDLTYVPGTTRPSSGVIVLVGGDGSRHEYKLEASGTPADVHAVGYYGGWHDGLSAGIYRGPRLSSTTITTWHRGPNRRVHRTCRSPAASVRPSTPWSCDTPAVRGWPTSSTTSSAPTTATGSPDGARRHHEAPTAFESSDCAATG
jgi:hypothetical protein